MFPSALILLFFPEWPYWEVGEAEETGPVGSHKKCEKLEAEEIVQYVKHEYLTLNSKTHVKNWMCAMLVVSVMERQGQVDTWGSRAYQPSLLSFRPVRNSISEMKSQDGA